MEDGGYNCYPKSRLLNGRRSPNFEGEHYLRVPKAGISNHKMPNEEFRLQCSSIVSKQERSTYENKTVKLLLWFATAVGGVALSCIVLIWFFLLKTSKRPASTAQGYLGLTAKFKRFTFNELRKATRGFKEVIGQGAGGIVYKGVLPDQRVEQSSDSMKLTKVRQSSLQK